MDNIIYREGRDCITSLGLFKNSTEFLNNKTMNILLVPFGKQNIINVSADVVYTASEETLYVSATLYKQRNGKYKLKVKDTEVSFT